MNKKKCLWGIIFLIAVLVCIFFGYRIISYYLSDGGNTSQYIEETTASTSYNKRLAENHNINWDKLKEDNADIYSWIYIPNTNVDYPVVQASKDAPYDFYLDHNIKKQSEMAGAIYSERNNTKDYMDPVTILYGHNMKNGSMFKTLHKFENPKFFKNNKEIYIYMPNRKLTYQIYAAYVYDDRHILNSFDFKDKKILRDYQQFTLNPDALTKNTRKVTLDADSRILTLSTCTNISNNTRYLVQGVLIKDEQTY